MNFLHASALLALAAIAVPVILHLRRQNRARPEMWAAMRFLRTSLVRRQKGPALEYLLLLACRCLLIFAFVFAMARPHINQFLDTRWILPSSLAVSAIILFLVAVLWRFSPKVRITAFILSLVGAVAATYLFATSQAGLQLLPNSPRDVVLILDCSASTTLPSKTLQTFASLRDEAALMVDDLPGGSTAAVIEAGSVVLPADAALNSNLRAVRDQLMTVQPHGGSCDLVKAVNAAKRLLERGSNAEKQILVFSDRQLRMWQSLADHLHNASETAEPASPVSPESPVSPAIQLFTRAVRGPAEGANPAVVELQWDHPTVRLNQPTTFKVRIYNGGSAISESCSLSVNVHDAVIFRQDGIRLAPDTYQEFQVSHQFQSTGPQIVTASLTAGGVLSADDALHRVIDVQSPLPILLVHSGNAGPLANSATFVKLALQPSPVRGDVEPDNAAPGNGEPEIDAPGSRHDSALTSLTAIDAAELPALSTFDEFEVILLCDVPRLPNDIAEKLARFVQDGGGLFVMAGRSAEPDFYNNWILDAKNPVLPVTFGAQLAMASDESPDGLRINLANSVHPTIQPLLESGQHDLGDLVVASYRKSAAREPADQNADNASEPVTGLQLTNRDPLLVEHTLGRGHVLTLLMSPDPSESNLIRRLSFPVLLHLWMQYLSKNQSADLQLAPAEEGLLPLGQLSSLEDETGRVLNEQSLQVLWPDGSKHSADLQRDGDSRAIRVGSLIQPGLHRITQTDADEASSAVSLPFTVIRSAEESELRFANDQQFNELLQQGGIQEIRDIHHLQQVSSGMPHGREIWDWFLMAVMGFVVLESAVQGWLRRRRQMAEIPA